MAEAQQRLRDVREKGGSREEVEGRLRMVGICWTACLLGGLLVSGSALPSIHPINETHASTHTPLTQLSDQIVRKQAALDALACDKYALEARLAAAEQRAGGLEAQGRHVGIVLCVGFSWGG